MVKKRKKQNKQWLCWGLVLIVVIAAVIAGVVVWQAGFTEDKHYEEQTSDINEQEEVQENSTEAVTENAELKSEGVEKEKVVQYDGDDPNEAESLSGAITRADVVGQTLVVRVNIDQYLGSGRCELSLVRGGATIYTDVVNIEGGASTSTCEGFDIPTSGLGSGNTQINIKISADGREGTIRGEVNI